MIFLPRQCCCKLSLSRFTFGWNYCICRGPTRTFDPHLDQVQILCTLLVRVEAGAGSLGLCFLIYERTALQRAVEMPEGEGIVSLGACEGLAAARSPSPPRLAARLVQALGRRLVPGNGQVLRACWWVCRPLQLAVSPRCLPRFQPF